MKSPDSETTFSRVCIFSVFRKRPRGDNSRVLTLLRVPLRRIARNWIYTWKGRNHRGRWRFQEAAIIKTREKALNARRCSKLRAISINSRQTVCHRGVRNPLPPTSHSAIFTENYWQYFHTCISIPFLSSFFLFFFLLQELQSRVKPSPTGYGLTGPLCTCREGE